MRYFGYFWVLFTLYFIIAHPAIIYYNTNFPGDLSQKNPVWALVLLAIAVVGWLTILIVSFRLIFKNTVGLQKGVLKLLQSGKIIEGKIVTVQSGQRKAGRYEGKKVKVSFLNFNGTPITYDLDLYDTKPHLNRYQPGKTIRLRVDQELKYIPYVIPADAEVTLNRNRLLILSSVWILALIGIVSYFVFAYTSENRGYGWRFLTFGHPLIISMLMTIGAGLLYFGVIQKYFFTSPDSSSGKKIFRLIFFGRKTTAFVSDVSQTGTYINENPQVRFTLKFVDDKGVQQQTTIKKVVQMIHLQNIHQPHQVIYYLPDDPTIVAFEEDLMD